MELYEYSLHEVADKIKNSRLSVRDLENLASNVDYKRKNPNVSKNKEVNSIEYLDDYIKNYCAFDAKWFLLKKNKG